MATTTTRLVTADDLLAMGDDVHVELIRGVLHDMSPTRHIHGVVCARYVMALGRYAVDRGGQVIAGEAGFVLERDPDTVLVPDVAFIRADRVPPRDRWNQFIEVVPDLMIEVLSPSNTRAEMDRKVAIYLAAGVPLIWVADPDSEQIVAHRPGAEPRIFGIDDVLDGGDVLPGFRVPVRTFFD